VNRLQREERVTLALQVHNAQAPDVPLLLTHGFGATAGMWDPNIDALSVDRPVDRLGPARPRQQRRTR
jgi:hypothetical protein